MRYCDCVHWPLDSEADARCHFRIAKGKKQFPSPFLPAPYLYFPNILLIEMQTRNWRDQKALTTLCKGPTVHLKHTLYIHLYHMIHSTQANRQVCFMFRFPCANFCLYRNWLPTRILHGLLRIPAPEVYIMTRQISFLVNIGCHLIHYFHSRRAAVNQRHLSSLRISRRLVYQLLSEHQNTMSTGLILTEMYNTT
jgi:hypothetical protein